MKSDLAIAALIRSRMTELALSRGEFAKRLGYKNVAKGIRRIDALCDGDLEGTKQFLEALPQALETSAETVKRALERTLFLRPVTSSRLKQSPSVGAIVLPRPGLRHFLKFFPDARVRGEHDKLGFVFHESLVTGLLGNQPAQLT